MENNKFDINGRIPVRAVYYKKDRVIFISHLDLLRTMQRSIKRAKLPVWYSEGFNPRIYLNFPLPLTLGISSECECMDFYLTEDIPFDEVRDRINAVLPEGIGIISVDTPVHLNKEICGAAYTLCFRTSDEKPSERMEDFTKLDSIMIEKKSKKKGITEVDIRPHCDFGSITDNGDGSAVMECTLPAGNEFSINGIALGNAFGDYVRSLGLEAECVYIKRTNVFCSDGSEFV